MKHFLACLFIFISFNHLAFASTHSPITTPTKPEVPKAEKKLYSAKDLDQFNSIKLTLKDDEGSAISFIQIKNIHDDYEVFISQSDYQKIIDAGVQLGNSNIRIVNEAEYLDLSKHVEVETSGKLTMNSYLGGEAGRCVAGTVGGRLAEDWRSGNRWTGRCSCRCYWGNSCWFCFNM